MPDNFVDVEIVTSASDLADEAIERLRESWDGWEPNEGDLEVIMVETIAPMAAAAAETAAQVPETIFRAYGTELIGLPYIVGVFATGAAIFTMVDDAGYTVPAGTEIDVDGFAFTTDEDVEVAEGDTVSTTVPITANTVGTAANDLTGEAVNMVSSLAFVDAVELDGATEDGRDEEFDDEYQTRLSRELELQAKTLVTTRDYELMALSYAEISRAVAIHLGERAVSVTLTDDDGDPVPTAVKDALKADYADYALVNTNVSIGDATYTTINVTYSVKAMATHDPAALIENIDAILGEELSPTHWGSTRQDVRSSDWDNDPVVRKNKLIDLIADVAGVAYVVDVDITGSAGSASGDDWTMPGVVALPLPGTMTGSTV